MRRAASVPMSSPADEGGRTRRCVSWPRNLHWKIVLRTNIGNVERAVFTHPTELRLINADLDAASGYGTKMSPRYHSVSFMESQHYIVYPANPRGALDDGIQHRLHVRGRAADDAEHLGRCRLMLQGLPQFCVASCNSLNNRTFSIAMTA